MVKDRCCSSDALCRECQADYDFYRSLRSGQQMGLLRAFDWVRPSMSKQVRKICLQPVLDALQEFERKLTK